MWASHRARRAINGRINVVDESRQSLTYESRLLKYALRGFALSVPGLDLSKLAPNLHEWEVSEASGLAKLLLMERALASKELFTSQAYARFDKQSPYNFGEHGKAVVKKTLDGLINPAASDYGGVNVRPRRGYHPFGLICLFIEGALRNSRDVPCVAARNDMGPILDAGGDMPARPHVCVHP